MFSFLKKRQVSIRSIVIKDFGWPQTKNDAQIIQWINPEQTIAISVNFFPLPPDLPTIKDPLLLRKFYRDSIAMTGGGLIQVDLVKKKDLTMVKTLFKLPQDPSGMTYLAALNIPFESCSFVLRVQAAELGATGIRETFVANSLLAKGDLTTNETGYQGWQSDPYDSNIKEGILMNKAEDSFYDQDFPAHPLTEARRIISEIEKSIKLRREIGRLRPFIK